MWGLLAPAIGSVLSGLTGNSSNNDARDDANAGYDKAMGAWNDAWGQVQGMWSPYQQAGTDALRLQDEFLRGDDSFKDTSEYTFAEEQGRESVSKLNAAQGSYFGGKNNLDTVIFGQGLANKFGNSYWDKLMGRAGMGMTANSNLTQFKSNQAGSIADLFSAQGENNANAELANGRNNQDMIGGIGGFIGNLLGGSNYGGAKTIYKGGR